MLKKTLFLLGFLTVLSLNRTLAQNDTKPDGLFQTLDQTDNGTFAQLMLEDKGLMKVVRVQASNSQSPAKWLFNDQSGDFTPKWARSSTGATTVNAHLTDYAILNGGTDGQVNTTAGNYYTFIIEDVTNTTADMAIIETDFLPQTIDDVSQTPTTSEVYNTQSVAVSIQMSDELDTDEAVYVRYTLNNWASSAFVQATQSTYDPTIYNASIPAQVTGTTVGYYVFSTKSSITPSHSSADFQTLELNNNGSSNYTYTVLASPAAPTVDGDMSDAQYAIIGSFTSGRDGFGSNNDLGEIKYYSDGINLYFGVTGELASNDNIVIFLNFSDYNGRPAGSNLDPDGSTEGSAGVFNNGGGLDDAKMDMEVDFALAFNEGNSSTNIYLDAARYGTTGLISNNYVGTVASQSGVASPLDVGTTFNNVAYNMRVAYDNSFASNASKGVEFSIPWSAFSGVDVTESSAVQFFAVITNNTGFFSNECIPGDPGGTNLGNDADFSAISGQDFFTNALLLPVELSDFRAILEHRGVDLQWTTKSELENAFFEVQRSDDGQNFEPIGRVEGGGTSLTPRFYTFLDNKPFVGDNYYRLRQVDFDGTFQLSDLVFVRAVESPQVRSFPNPANDRLVVRTDATGDFTVRLFNLSGQLIQTFAFVQKNLLEFPVRDLQAGFYFIEVLDNQGVLLKQSFIKQ